MANQFCLDASALLAVLHKEEGYELVQSNLRSCAISTVNVCEVVQRGAREGIDTSSYSELLERLGVTVVPFENRDAIVAGQLISFTFKHGLSLADRACIALALREGLSALTSDRAWANLELGIEILLIR